MPDDNEKGTEKDKEKEKATTKAMPHASMSEFDEWVKKQQKAEPKDKGESPPAPPEDQKEPREHGSKEREEGKPK